MARRILERCSNGDIDPQLSTISAACDEAGRLTNDIAVSVNHPVKRSEEELGIGYASRRTHRRPKGAVRARLELREPGQQRRDDAASCSWTSIC